LAYKKSTGLSSLKKLLKLFIERAIYKKLDERLIFRITFEKPYLQTAMTLSLRHLKWGKKFSDPPSSSFTDERRDLDRRKRRIPPIRFLIFGGRRKTVRRKGPHRRIILLDHYSERLFAIISAILILSLIDAVMTLYLINHGATEINPVMAYFLRKGSLFFIVAKYVLTTLSVIMILLVKHTILPYFRFHATNLFVFALAAFGLVVSWEVALVWMLSTGQ
jgi:hypothetical protein